MEPTQAQQAAAAGLGIGVFAVIGVLLIVSFICWLKVLIALFKKEGAGLGILGLLCGPYLYIWGWMKSTELQLKKAMIWWTLSILAFVVVWFVAVAGAVGMAMNSPEFKKAMEDAQRKAQEQQIQQQGEPAPVPAPAPTTN